MNLTVSKWSPTGMNVELPDNEYFACEFAFGDAGPVVGAEWGSWESGLVVEIAVGGVVGPGVTYGDGLPDGVAAEDYLVAFDSGLGPVENPVFAC